MPFNRPTLQDLLDRARADIESRLPGADAALRRRVLDVLARTHAGAAHGLYAYLDWIARQVFVDSAEAEILERHAANYGVNRRAGAAATGNVVFTGTSGTLIPVGLILQRADGAQYRVQQSVAIAAGTASIPVSASLNGVAGNADTGVALTVTTPITGVSGAATIAAPGLAGGVAPEDDDSLRARTLRRIQQPPQGGAARDYVSWALEVPSVTRAWVYARELGAGTVVVRFVMDNKVGSSIPNAGEVALVQAYIDARRPVTADVTVAAPTPVSLNFTIQLLPDAAATRIAVETELRDMLFRDAQPGGTILLSHLREAISIAAGEADHILTAPGANVIYTTGQMPIFGVITWP